MFFLHILIEKLKKEKKQMKDFILGLIVCIAIAVLVVGCTQQGMTKDMGGSTTIELEPNTKLEEITWKDNSLWYLTRSMTDDDVAETHTFRESSEYGVFEGTVTIIEKKTK